MSTISVFVLVISVGLMQPGGITVIDNIATRDECERVAKAVYNAGQIPHFKGMRCIEVLKVKP